MSRSRAAKLHFIVRLLCPEVTFRIEILLLVKINTLDPTVSNGQAHSSGFKLRKKSLVSSKLSQLLAMLGATLSKFGTIPLYRPRKPSCDMMVRMAWLMDLY